MKAGVKWINLLAALYRHLERRQMAQNHSQDWKVRNNFFSWLGKT